MTLFIDSITKLNLNNKNQSYLKTNIMKLLISLIQVNLIMQFCCLMNVKLDSTSEIVILLSKCYYNLDLKIEFLQNIKKALFIDSTNGLYFRNWKLLQICQRERFC